MGPIDRAIPVPVTNIIVALYSLCRWLQIATNMREALRSCHFHVPPVLLIVNDHIDCGNREGGFVMQ
jgi:hypothetical protein